MFKKILIANRGEIACRIIKTCKEMGIKTVAVYGDPDEFSLHRFLADESICIGGPTLADSYLNMKKLTDAALEAGADAIHPGYGFLSENHEFGERCFYSGIKFIGPEPEVIKMMGDKLHARATAMRIGVPVVPGTDKIEDINDAKKFAHQVGYPVMIKAVGGGGGKGIRLAWDDKELTEQFIVAKDEAKRLFKSEDVYIEKYLEEPHHVEIQVLGDINGNAWHFEERDCSVQRRHQKLIEESPSTILTPELRKRMCESAIKCVTETGYVGVGTVEFLVDKHRNYYFIEMNTRIQVEHPVTEIRSRVDLVLKQILAASGEKIELTQDQILLKGHAIECRINAEDPYNNFTPNVGQFTLFSPPGGFGIRVDTHVYASYYMPTYYDSLIGKLIVWGETRKEAIARMKLSLDTFMIGGVKSTIAFHQYVMRNDNFFNGNYSTLLVDQIMKNFLESNPEHNMFEKINLHII
mgnify:CR=1 FL=1